jgi:hypothetical protein
MSSSNPVRMGFRAAIAIGIASAAAAPATAHAACTSAILGIRVVNSLTQAKSADGTLSVQLKEVPGDGWVDLCVLGPESPKCQAWLSLAQAAYLSNRPLMVRTSSTATCENIRDGSVFYVGM